MCICTEKNPCTDCLIEIEKTVRYQNVNIENSNMKKIYHRNLALDIDECLEFPITEGW